MRVQAHEVRRSLARYYESEGRHDPIRIELPPGNYAPTFMRAKNGEAGGALEAPAEIKQPARGANRWVTGGLAIATLTLGT